VILVTGANGMVGSYVTDVFSEGPLALTDIDTMDIQELNSVRNVVKNKRPQIILHLAAATEVDECEKDGFRCYKTNVLGTENIALAALEVDATVVYISTGMVFDGKKPEPYTEFDKPNPINHYSKSKYEGEKVIERLLRKYFIVRAGWMIGGKEKDKKFISKILQLCKTKEEISIVNDKFGTITYAKHLLMTIKALLSSGRFGLYHCVNEGPMTRFEIGKEIAAFIKSNVKIHAVPTACFPLPAPRPRSEALENFKLNLIGLNKNPSGKEAISEYLSDWLGR
jgi:dTDP-4-dehydrorhamnose reductase